MDDLHERLAPRGFRDVGSSFGFVLIEARNHALGVTDVARLMGISKQAASKLVSSMEQCGYLRATAAEDQRAHLVEISPRGRKLLAAVEDIYRELEAEWAAVIGAQRVEAIRADLTAVLVARHGALPKVRPTK
jgi:DNA-binding MarR family transcriptional regulator